MDITLTKDQEVLYRTARSFAQGALSAERVRGLETSDQGFDAACWRQMVELGWAGAVFPQELGGAGLSLFEMALIVEACGQAALPSPLFSTVVEAGLLLQEGGSPAQRSYWLPRIAAGQALLATAFFEPEAQQDLSEILTEVWRSSGGYRISGTKLFVRHADTADMIICLGRSGSGPEDFTLLAVPRHAPGVAMTRLHASGGEPLYEVTFDGVTVPAAAEVGEAGRAWSLVKGLCLRGACLKAAELVGIGQAALDLTVSYAKVRTQFERPIGSFQAVHHHCADMYRDLQACRLLSYQAAACLAAGRPAEREVSIAKAKASEAIPALTRLAHQIHGSIAYYRDYPLELFYHRALAAQAAYGNAAFHRRQLARILREEIGHFRREYSHELPVHYL